MPGAAEPTSLEDARAKALRLLAARPRTEAQIRDRLERQGQGHFAAEVVAWLRHLGYLDDAAYARSRARTLLAPGRLGPRLAERRLVAAGIEAAEARAAVAAALAAGGEPSGPAEDALCRALAEKRLRGRHPEALGEREREGLARFLLGRGFSPGAVGRALGTAVDDVAG